MGELVELDVTTVEESVTVNVTEEGQVQVAVFAEKGETGPAGPAGPNSVTSATTSDGTAELEVLLLTAAEGITANRGVNETSAIYADGGNGNAINATSETDAVIIASDNGTALTVTSNTGNDIAVFRDASQNGINIENPRGWLTWVYEPGEIYLGRLKTADITANREWTLPNASGTVALTDDPRFTDARTPLAHTHVVSDIVSIAGQHLIGRHAGGTGAGQAVDVGNGIEFQGSGIRRSALTGDITASAGSNATTLAATIAGDKTFSGQLQLTGQAATDASSAMTRGLVRGENLQNLWMPISWNATTGTVNTSGTLQGLSVTLVVNSGSVLGNNRICTIAQNYLNRQGSGANQRMSGAKWSAMYDITFEGPRNNEIRLLFGVAAATLDLNSVVGIGLVILPNSNNAKLQINNGSSLLESANFSLTNNNFRRILLTWDGSTFTCYLASHTDTAEAPRFSLVANLTGSSLPNTSSGVSWNMVLQATDTNTFVSVFSLRAAQFCPYVVIP